MGVHSLCLLACLGAVVMLGGAKYIETIPIFGLYFYRDRKIEWESRAGFETGIQESVTKAPRLRCFSYKNDRSTFFNSQIFLKS